MELHCPNSVYSKCRIPALFNKDIPAFSYPGMPRHADTSGVLSRWDASTKNSSRGPTIMGFSGGDGWGLCPWPARR